MKKIYIIAFIAVYTLVSCSEDKDDSLVFETKKIVFKEKKEQLLYFFNGKQLEPNDEQRTYYYNNMKDVLNEKTSKDNSYFLFETENTLRMSGIIQGDNIEKKSFKYKFENGLLKVEYEGKYSVIAFGNDLNKITMIDDLFIEYYKTSNGESTVSGDLGPIEDDTYWLSPLSFDSAKQYLTEFKNIEDIKGEDFLYLQRIEYIFE